MQRKRPEGGEAGSALEALFESAGRSDDRDFDCGSGGLWNDGGLCGGVVCGCDHYHDCRSYQCGAGGGAGEQG